jgi:PAS domain S-box-containing protein
LQAGFDEPDENDIMKSKSAGGHSRTKRTAIRNTATESFPVTRFLADAAPVLIWMSGADRLCNYFSGGWLAFTGRTLREESGNGWAVGVHPDDLKRWLDAYNSAFDSRSEFQIQYRLRRHDGEYRWILAHGVPRFAPANEFLGYIGSCVDVTERERAEQTLRTTRDELDLRVRERTAELVRANTALQDEISARRIAETARTRLAAIVESSSDAILSRTLDGIITSWNHGAEMMLGYAQTEIIGRSVSTLIPADRADELAPIHKRLRRGETVESFETVRVRKDGRRVDVSLTLSPIKDDAGRVTGLSAIMRDTTDRKQAGKALRESEARLQAIMDNSPAMIFLKDTQGRYLHFNQRFGREFHLRLDEAVGKTDAEIFPRELAAAFRANDAMVVQTGKPMVFDETAAREDGAQVGIVTKFPLRDADGNVYAVGGIVTDVTELRRLEAEILRISEREQRRIAQDLHDGLGQQLSGISLLSNALMKDLLEQGSAAAPAAARISELLDSAVAQTRSLARGLFPVVQEPTGLMFALEDLASRTAGLFKISCRFECSHPVLIRSDATATHLFWIAQEAVANALKHGRAQEITIRLASAAERIVLAVSDNGAGFHALANQPKGLGFRIMHYRASVLGGTLVVGNRIGGGVQVICTLEKVLADDSGDNAKEKPAKTNSDR